MDDYPDHLSPAFDEGGGVATPFEEWWPRVRASFPNVPEEVARQWLHRHWRHSPFSWLKSADYNFEKVTWPSGELSSIRYRINEFADSTDLQMQFGKQLLAAHERHGIWLAEYMLDTGLFPVPIIVADNRDGHLVDHAYKDSNYFPKTYVLIEGHRRLEFGTFLASRGQLAPTQEIWIMRRA
jgi:hypothetical protein